MSFGNLLFTIIFLIGVYILTSLFRLRHIFRFARQHNGYTFIPIIGNGLHFLSKNLFQNVQNIITRHGLPCNMWLGHNYNYVTADPDEIKIIMNHPNALDKASLNDVFSFLLKGTLLVVPANIWKGRRKFHSRSFSPKILKDLVPCFYRTSEIVLEILKKSNGVDAFHIFENLAIDIFLESLLEKDYSVQLSPGQYSIAANIENFQKLTGRFIIYMVCLPQTLWKMSTTGRKIFKSSDELIKFAKNAVTERRQFLQSQPELLDDASLPLLNSILKYDKDDFTDEQRFREMIMFTAAASDTTGFSLSYVFTMLGMHPDIQAKVYDEVISVVGHDHVITADDLPNLKYTEQCINESMRLLPAIPHFGRKADADIDLGTKILPKSADIFITIFNLHRNEKYWPNPLKYDPDRFLPEEIAKRHPYAFLPFSGGPRNCIGKTYAMMLMKVTVANVIRNFEIYSKYRSVTELKFRSVFTMQSDHPLHCEFKSRTNPKIQT